MSRFMLDVPQPSSFAHLQARVAQSSQRAFFRVTEHSLGRAVRIHGKPCFLEVSTLHAPVGFWQVDVFGGSVTTEETVRAKVWRLFSLDADLNAFYCHASREAPMRHLIEEFKGARLLRDEDVFAAAVSSIISQQLNLSFAAELKRRLWALAGSRVDVGEDTFYADPTPEAIASLSYEQLRELQFSQRKAEYVIDLARAVVDGSLDLEGLRQMPDEAAIEQLSRMRGVGSWTAECILLFGLGRPDLLPAKDVGLLRAVTRFWQLPERLNEEEMRARAERWRPWRSWYTYYLWLALSLPETRSKGE